MNTIENKTAWAADEIAILEQHGWSQGFGKDGISLYYVGDYSQCKLTRNDDYIVFKEHNFDGSFDHQFESIEELFEFLAY